MNTSLPPLPFSSVQESSSDALPKPVPAQLQNKKISSASFTSAALPKIKPSFVSKETVPSFNNLEKSEPENQNLFGNETIVPVSSSLLKPMRRTRDQYIDLSTLAGETKGKPPQLAPINHPADRSALLSNPGKIRPNKLTGRDARKSFFVSTPTNSTGSLSSSNSSDSLEVNEG